MRTEAELRRAYYLLGALIELNVNASETLPESELQLVKHTHSALAWADGGRNKFGLFLDALESTLAANDIQIVEVEGGARLMPLRSNHRPARKRRREAEPTL